MRRGVLARPPRARHRPHRLQGRLAGAVAASAGRGGHGPRRWAPDRRRSLLALVGADEGARRCASTCATPNAVAARLREVEPEVVFHLAAQPLVRRSYADPVGTYAINVHGHGERARGAARTRRGVRAVVIVTTDKCYENRERGGGYREDDAAGRPRPLQRLEGRAELVDGRLSRALLRSGASAVATARAGNVIGGGDWARRPAGPRRRARVARGRAGRAPQPAGACGRGSTCSNPLRGYLLLAERLLADPGSAPRSLELRPADGDARRSARLVER